MDGKKRCRLRVAVGSVRGSSGCVLFCKGMVMGIVEKFKRKLYEACGDDFYDKLDEDLRQTREEIDENYKTVEAILALLEGKKAGRAKGILRDALNKIIEKQENMII